jgi:hypothetical protein
MYRVQYTSNAHVFVPERAWIDGSRHRTLETAVRAMRRFKTPAPSGCWANHVRVIDEATGEQMDTLCMERALEDERTLKLMCKAYKADRE